MIVVSIVLMVASLGLVVYSLRELLRSNRFKKRSDEADAALVAKIDDLMEKIRRDLL